MNPITIVTAAFSLITTFGPMLPHLVTDASQLVADGDKVIAAIKDKSLSELGPALEAVLAEVETDFATVGPQILQASKSLALT